MSTLLLAILLIALIAIGMLMAAKPIREMFENPTPKILASSVISEKSPTLISLTATPALTAESAQVDVVGRGQSIQNVTDSASSSAPLKTSVSGSYTDIGTGEESSIRSWADLTPTEAAVVQALIVKGGGDITAPLTPPSVTLVVMFRKSGQKVIAGLAKGDTTLNSDDITLEEYSLVMSDRKTKGIPDKAPPSDAEKAIIENRRKAYLQKQIQTGGTAPVAAPVSSSSAASGSGPVPLGLVLTSDEKAAVLRMRKAEDIKKARNLLAQTKDTPVNSNPTNRRRAKNDNDYDDDYSGYEKVPPSQRKRLVQQNRNQCEECPDMSQYVKMDEIPCWNCSLP
jgi:hypothetical protein